MKNFVTLSFAFLLVFAAVPELNATNGMPRNYNLTDTIPPTARPIAPSPIIPDTDQSTISFRDINELRDEKQPNNSNAGDSHGGIYISVGALLIIILILILIL